MLLCNEQHTMTYASNSEVYLSLNGRYFAANSLKYASKCELFIQNETLKSQNVKEKKLTEKEKLIFIRFV